MTTKIPVELSSTPGIADSSNATAITITSDEKVGIGCTPVQPFQVRTQSDGNVVFQNSTSVTGGVKINCFNDAANTSKPFEIDGSSLQFNIAATERMRIASGGGVAIGTTTPDGVSNLTVKSQNSTAGQEFVSLHHQATSGLVYFISFMTEASGVDRGYITYNNTGNTMQFTGTSDISLKENIKDLTGGLDFINQIKPRVFDWKEEGKGKDQVGFIAQEVEEIKPEWVGEKEGLKNIPVNLPNSIPYLIKAIQEQQTQIEALQSEINTLKGE